MKKRVKTDSALLSFVIIMTGILFTFRNLYSRGAFLDDSFDFIGFIVLLSGVLLRMSARGHKKAHSKKSEKLVMSGPYTLVRNPMYLGSFLMGAGFILMVWPWWGLPFFALLFYARFQRQVVKEEKYLGKLAGKEYEQYCNKVNRIFPSLDQLKRIKIRTVVNMREAWSTKEKRGLWSWPLLAVLLESFQEKLIFEETFFSQTVLIFCAAGVVFAFVFWLAYRKDQNDAPVSPQP